MSHPTQTPCEISSYSLTELAADSDPQVVAAARELLLEYGSFVAAQPTVATFCFGTLQQEAAELPHTYPNQNGGAILATRGSRPAGFIAWRSLPLPELASAWELKRLWIRPEARGSGLGSALVESVISRARLTGKTELVLDTAPDSMAAAVCLYRKLGFVDCPCYNGCPKAGILYLRKSL